MQPHTNTDRLKMMYEKPGPFVTVFVPEGDDDAEHHPSVRLHAQRDQLEARGATHLALNAIDARLSLPVFGDVGGRAVIAAADGSTVVDTAHEGPAEDAIFVGPLPYAAPLLEWQQWRVPHIAVLADTDLFEAVAFQPGVASEIRPIGSTADDAASTLAHDCREDEIELVIVTGADAQVQDLVGRLHGVVPTSTEVVSIGEDDVHHGDMAASVVRTVADKVARRTVTLLREFRFLAEHDGAAQGAIATIASLAAGTADIVLVHDDPDDDRTAWFGPDARDLALARNERCPQEGRLVDVVIRSAVMQDSAVRIIPSTGERGPDENVAALLRDPTVAAPTDAAL